MESISPAEKASRLYKVPEGLGQMPSSQEILEQGPQAKPTRRGLCLMQSGQFMYSRCPLPVVDARLGGTRKLQVSDKQGP